MHAWLHAPRYEKARAQMPGTPRPMDSLSAASSQILEPTGRGTMHHHHSHSQAARDALMPPPPLLLEPYLGPKNPTSPLPHPSKSPASPRLGLCTEGLGSDSSDGVDMDDVAVDAQALPCKRQHRSKNGDDDVHDKEEEPVLRRTRSGRPFPPPISVIGTGGRPWLCLRPHREANRLVLQEMRLSSQEQLHACREDGRLKLQFVHPDAAAVLGQTLHARKETIRY